MTIITLEKILYQEGNFVRARDGSKVNPFPVGNPIAEWENTSVDASVPNDSYWCQAEKLAIKRATEQSILNEVNAYSATETLYELSTYYPSKFTVVAIQLYKI